ALQDLGVLAAVDPALTFVRARAADALALLPADASRELLLLAALLPTAAAGEDAAARSAALLDRLEFSAQDRDGAVASAASAGLLAQAMKGAERPSQLHATLARRPLQAVALAGADGDRAVQAAAHEWFDRLRHVALEINGDDLLAAGVPAGPEVGARLAAAL